MPPDSASDLKSLLETLHGYEDTFAETPKNTIRRLDPSEAIAAAFTLLKEGGRGEDSLRFNGLLGEGGMGKVRLAEQRSMGRDVAVKGLRDIEQPDVSQAHALVSEGWVMGALEHPNIPPVYDLMLDDQGSPLVLLKRIEGDEWLHLMTDEAAVRERFDEPLLNWNLSVLDTICNAIKYAHSKGIVHRDLKPENVMIGAFGEVYVLDWGIAVGLSPDPQGKIPYVGDTTHPAGTPCYMSPELLRNDLGVTLRTDVYLVGAMLFEAITGKPPHMGITMKEMVQSIERSEPTFDNEVPTALQAICTKAMQARAEDRYESIEDLQAALRDYQHRRATETLTDEAMTRLSSLRLLAEAAESDERFSKMSALFSECRFAFRQSLVAYPGEERATLGLTEATELMARVAVAGERIDAAKSFLAEMPAPSDALVDELAALQERAAQQSERFASLERQQDADVDKGQRTYLLVVFALAVTLPWLGHSVMDSAYYVYISAFAWQAFILVGFVLAYPRFKIESTEQNRLTYIAITAALAAELLATFGGWAAGLPLTQALLIDSACWTTAAVVVVLAMGWIYLPVAMGYWGAMLVIALYPEYTFYGIAAANLTLLVCATIVYVMKIQPKPLVRMPRRVDDH